MTVSVDELMNKFMKETEFHEFKPFARFDANLDCIRVRIKDCSYTEERLNRFFTLAIENHGHDELVGFTIKEVSHIWGELQLPELTELINGIVRQMKL